MKDEEVTKSLQKMRELESGFKENYCDKKYFELMNILGGNGNFLGKVFKFQKEIT